MSSNQPGGAATPLLPPGIAIDIRVEMERDFIEYGEYFIVTTVRHTGTHSIKKQFPNYKHWHCNPQALDLIKSTLGHADVITTHRDPLRVAASWYNRAQLPAGTKDYRSPHNAGCVFSWKEAWFNYGEILKLIPKENIFEMDDLDYKLYAHPDDQGMHKLLDSGDMDGFYSIADKELIDYAYNQIC